MHFDKCKGVAYTLFDRRGASCWGGTILIHFIVRKHNKHLSSSQFTPVFAPDTYLLMTGEVEDMWPVSSMQPRLLLYFN